MLYFIHETKTKYEDKKSFKDDTVCIITHLIGLIGLYKACNLCIDSLGNTHPLKVDRNLQWMSHHPTNPTYNPVLSGTMTHLSARCQKTAPPGHTIQTHTSKRCVSAIWHTVCQHSENVTTVHVVPNATDQPNN